MTSFSVISSSLFSSLCTTTQHGITHARTPFLPLSIPPREERLLVFFIPILVGPTERIEEDGHVDMGVCVYVRDKGLWGKTIGWLF